MGVLSMLKEKLEQKKEEKIKCQARLEVNLATVSSATAPENLLVFINAHR